MRPDHEHRRLVVNRAPLAGLDFFCGGNEYVEHDVEPRAMGEQAQDESGGQMNVELNQRKDLSTTWYGHLRRRT